VLVLYSDGVTEAEAAGTGEFFGVARLTAVVAGARGGSAVEILEAVLEALRKFSGGTPPSDDRTLVVVRAT
jgi:sigma-B regulation protein RsbU (phosphoserine phosphatase)